jgi:hypothetical protein
MFVNEREKIVLKTILEYAAENLDFNEVEMGDIHAMLERMKDRYIVLQQTGDAPFRFEGRLIAKVGGQHFKGKDVNRFFVIELYQSKSSEYILSISYQTVWDGEANRHDVLICPTPQDVRLELIEWEAVPEGIGFPPHPEYASKQERLLNSLYNQYDDLVSELLTNAGEEFSIFNGCPRTNKLKGDL